MQSLGPWGRAQRRLPNAIARIIGGWCLTERRLLGKVKRFRVNRGPASAQVAWERMVCWADELGRAGGDVSAIVGSISACWGHLRDSWAQTGGLRYTVQAIHSQGSCREDMAWAGESAKQHPRNRTCDTLHPGLGRHKSGIQSGWAMRGGTAKRSQLHLPARAACRGREARDARPPSTVVRLI